MSRDNASRENPFEGVRIDVVADTPVATEPTTAADPCERLKPHPECASANHYAGGLWRCHAEARQPDASALREALETALEHHWEHDINCGIDALRLGEDIGCTCYVRTLQPDENVSPVTEPTTAAGRDDLRQIMLNAIRYRSEAIGVTSPVLRADILWLLQYIDRAEARQPDDSALRTALRGHTPTLHASDEHGTKLHCACGHRDHMAGWWAHIRVGVLEPALAALPPSAPPALDVERLARVLQNSTNEAFGPITDEFWLKQAEALAAEYARLAQDRSPEPSE